MWNFAAMRIVGVIGLFLLYTWANGQNLELSSGKDIRQPGKINPALAGIQEDLIRVLSDAEINESYQFMLEGRIPLKMGNYMIGVERTFTDDVSNNMFNLTYGRKTNEGKKFQWRYGASLKFNSKSLTIPGYDSSSGYVFKDINGEVKSVKSLNEIRNSVDYFDMEIGASMTYKNLIVGAGIENIMGNNVSLTTSETRSMPFTANVLVGGFINFGENNALFPSAIFVMNEDEYYGKASIDFSTKKVNIAAAYINENDISDVSGSVAIKVEKVFAGIKYTHPISGDAGSLVNKTPSFNLFFNSTVFKSRSLFKSDFAKMMKKVY